MNWAKSKVERSDTND